MSRYQLIWDGNFSATVKFYTENNRWPSHGAKDENEKRLGRWVRTQRETYRNGEMSAGRVLRLEAVSGWVWDPFAEAWEAGFNGATKFYSENNRWPSAMAADESEKKLGLWVGAQRTQGKKFAAGELSTLNQERWDRLNATTGWLWTARARTWETWLADVTEFYTENNRWPSHGAKDENEKALGRWVASQRKHYKKGNMSEERLQRLEEVSGWVWSAR